MMQLMAGNMRMEPTIEEKMQMAFYKRLPEFEKSMVD